MHKGKLRDIKHLAKNCIQNTPNLLISVGTLITSMIQISRKDLGFRSNSRSNL